MSHFEPRDRSQIRRIPDRGHYDAATIYDIIDEALICHVGFSIDDRPFVLPMIHARDEDRLLFHGAKASRMLKHFQGGLDICVTITLLDGLVLARSVFHHSMNYRSVVIFGTGSIIEDPGEKLRGLELLTEHLIPGRWQDARLPSEKEMNATTLVSMRIEEASAKIRSGPPGDDEEDYELQIWAGVLPIRQQILDPVAGDRISEGIPVPDYVRSFVRMR